MKSPSINIIGGGLAGSEAALQLAHRGINVRLFEMKPRKFSPAHKIPGCAELVCSNTFKSTLRDRAHGLLKEELQKLGSYLIKIAYETRVPAGDSLAVDRVLFSEKVTEEISKNPRIEFIREEVSTLNDEDFFIIATGPLTGESLFKKIQQLIGDEDCYFFDAISPIVAADSIDYSRCFFANRRDPDGKDYINAPMAQEEYDLFIHELTHAEEAQVKDFDSKKLFSGCMPIEDMAKRGPKTLAFGPLRPVGFESYGKRPYAIVQLRREDNAAKMYNLVGFQTRLKIGEQERVFRMIPGLEKCEFLRYGSMHRNNFINSPKVLQYDFSLKTQRNIFFAGQIIGVEGYTESIASGLLTAQSVLARMEGKTFILPHETTMLGGVFKYILEYTGKNFQPMNANFGLLPHLEKKIGKSDRYAAYAERALKKIDTTMLIL